MSQEIQAEMGDFTCIVVDTVGAFDHIESSLKDVKNDFLRQVTETGSYPTVEEYSSRRFTQHRYREIARLANRTFLSYADYPLEHTAIGEAHGGFFVGLRAASMIKNLPTRTFLDALELKLNNIEASRDEHDNDEGSLVHELSNGIHPFLAKYASEFPGLVSKNNSSVDARRAYVYGMYVPLSTAFEFLVTPETAIQFYTEDLLAQLPDTPYIYEYTDTHVS